MKTITNFLALALVLAMTAVAGAQSVEIKQKDGSRWRGDVGDQVEVTYLEQGVDITMTGELTKVASLYIIVRGDIAGSIRDKTIFRGDIVRMKDAKDAASESTTAQKKPEKPERDPDAPTNDIGEEMGVFVLPLVGGVGQEFRVDEIIEIGKHADTFGPGQTIVLIIDSNGGLVFESLQINEAIWDMKERSGHRVVAWVRKAISAGCSTAMACDEIYFMSEGSAGSVTTLAGGQALGGAEAEKHVSDFVRVAKRSGYSEHIARAMKLNKYMCSYDKDPETGEITWYGDTSGAFVLSNAEQNLSFNASNALHCGFSKGTADTEEELAEFLGLERWYEIDDYGRKIASKWQKTAKEAQDAIPRLLQQYGYKNTGTGDAKLILSTKIRILKDVLRWWDRAPNIARMTAPPEEQLERMIKQHQRELELMRRAERGR